MGDDNLQLHQLSEIRDHPVDDSRPFGETPVSETVTLEPVGDTSETREKKRSKLWGLFRQYFVEPFSGSTNPPWFDARGIAVGLAVGFGVPVGAQVAVMALLRAMFRYNTVVAFAFSWVNNPFTMIPMYYAYYYVGSLLMGKPVVVTGEMFREMMVPIVQADHFLQSIEQFMYLGWDVLIRWLLTAFILAATSSILGYVIGLRVRKAHCRRKAERMGVTYEKLLARLEKTVQRAKE
jgi:uncharacterized protein (DUF2062 family)